MDDDTKEKVKIILKWLVVIAIIIGLGMLAQYVLVVYPPPHAVQPVETMHLGNFSRVV